MLTVKLEIHSLNFFWGEKGYKWFDGTPIKCSWEDIGYDIYRGDKKLEEGSTTVEARSYVEQEIEQLHGSLGARMEVKFPGYIEEELNSTYYGIPFKDIPACNEPLWCFSYQDRDDEDFYQIEDMINLPKDEHGVYPSYITGYIPEEFITRANVEAYMADYIKRYKGFDEGFEFVWEGVPSDETLEKEYQETIVEMENWNKDREKGIETKIMLLPQPLAMFLGKDKVEELVARGMTHAEKVGEEDDFVYHFEDGHTELSGTEIDSSDHFSEPEKDWE